MDRIVSSAAPPQQLVSCSSRDSPGTQSMFYWRNFANKLGLLPQGESGAQQRGLRAEVHTALEGPEQQFRLWSSWTCNDANNLQLSLPATQTELTQLHHPCSFCIERNETQGLYIHAHGPSADLLSFLAEKDERRQGLDAIKTHQNSGNSDNSDNTPPAKSKGFGLKPWHQGSVKHTGSQDM